MKDAKKKKLKSKGWEVASASDFLGLTPEESKYIQEKSAPSRILKKKEAAKNSSRILPIH